MLLIVYVYCLYLRMIKIRCFVLTGSLARQPSSIMCKEKVEMLVEAAHSLLGASRACKSITQAVKIHSHFHGSNF